MMDGLERSLDELCEVICKKRRPSKEATHSGNGKPVETRA
jgi:hypothetical protein